MDLCKSDSRSYRPIAFWLISVSVFLAAWQINWTARGEQTGENFDAELTPDDERGDLMREGTPLTHQLGLFQVAGDRVVFTYDNKRLVGLENLTLERIGRVVRGVSTPIEWTVEGVITEYQGSNYLQVKKAVMIRRQDAGETSP